MIIVFPNQQALDEFKPSLPSGVEVGNPVTSLDGRVAISHEFTNEDLITVQQNVDALVLIALPDDWQYEQEEISQI